jgi:hypothetical protein
MPSLDEWNWYTLMLGQALIGAISENIMAVDLSFSENCWVVGVVLNEYKDDDVVEMEDVVDEMSCFIEDVKEKISTMSYKRIICKIYSGKNDVCLHGRPDNRVVFMRKELFPPD